MFGAKRNKLAGGSAAEKGGYISAMQRVREFTNG